MSREVRQVRTDEIRLIKTDTPAPNIRYVGRSYTFGAADTDEMWQILRVSRVGDVITSTYGLKGSFVCKWSDRTTYFPFVAYSTDGLNDPANPATTPNVKNITVPFANIESSYAFPANTKRFTLTVRSGGFVQVSYTLGGSGVEWIELNPGSIYSEEDLDVPNLTLYYQVSAPGTVIEITSWS